MSNTKENECMTYYVCDTRCPIKRALCVIKYFDQISNTKCNDWTTCDKSCVYGKKLNTK